MKGFAGPNFGFNLIIGLDGSEAASSGLSVADVAAMLSSLSEASILLT